MQSSPKCIICGKPLEKFLKSKNGDGLFCSINCSYSFSALKRDKNFYILAMKNRRSYKGQNNPNYGKKASEEIRKKMSESQKLASKNSKSTRFKGHKHSEESKLKTSETLKKKYALKKQDNKKD